MNTGAELLVTITKHELTHLRERARKCSMDKSYLQMVIRLMNQVSATTGLEDMVDSLLHNLLDVIGGTNIILYYWVDSETFYADVYGKKMLLDTIDDNLVQQVIAFHEPIEFEQPFSDTKLTTPEFTKAFTWVYPLLVGTDIIGVFKMENLHVGMHGLNQYLSIFSSFVALALNNEILGQTRIKQAYNRLSDTIHEMTMEIEERERVEEELRKAKDGLEEKNRQLERMNKLFVGRELRMIELKEKIRDLEKLVMP